MLLRKIFTAAMCLIAVPVAAGATDQARPLAVGDTFPQLKSKFLTGREAVLPDVARGKSALIMMGFTYDSRFVVEEWAKAFTREFGGREDVTFFQVPVIGGMGRLASRFINSGMRKGTPPAQHENVITLYGGGDRWKRTVGFDSSQPDTAYLILIDANGRVTWIYRGACGDEAVGALRDALRRVAP